MRVRDNVPRWRPLDLPLHDRREPHDYQVEALAAWDEAGRLGSIVLPTGAGKTFVALQAIHRVNRSALVVAPTIDLLHQWYARLANAFATEIGVYYGGEKQVQPITVTTYHSAGDLIAEAGNLFKLIIYDEVHHLPAPSWGETALMSPALHRLGLTATYPEDARTGAGALARGRPHRPHRLRKAARRAGRQTAGRIPHRAHPRRADRRVNAGSMTPTTPSTPHSGRPGSCRARTAASGTGS